MYSNIRKLLIKGGKFKELTPIEIFSENRAARVIYGKNGTGKSTLTKAILKNKEIDYPIEIEGKFLDKLNNEIVLTDEMKKNIFVFNEEYIENNIKLKSAGLGSIVILGKQNELDLEIKKIENKILRYENLNDILNNVKIKTKEEEDGLFTKIISNLKGDINWAGIDREIKGNRQNTQVNQSTVNEIIKCTSSKQYEELFEELIEKKEEYLKLSNQENQILEDIKFKVCVEEDYLIELLQKDIKEKKLSEREEKILDLVLNGKQEFYKQVKNDMKDKSLTQCPYCLQEIENKYREEIVKTLENIFDAEAEKYIDELKEAEIKYLQQKHLDLKVYRSLDLDLCNVIEEKMEAINLELEKYRNHLKEKKENIFKKITIEKIEINKKIVELEEEIKKLNFKIKLYNKKINELSKLKEEVLSLNKKVACSKIINTYKEYQEKNNKFKKIETILVKCQGRIAIKKSKKLELENEKNNTKIAIKHMNNALNYIFFSGNRLKIKEGENNTYKLFSNGIEVSPSNVSCGERNILALCYFFIEILNNAKEEEFYKNEIFLVIDDPISSFDKNNKIGIFSFLRMQFFKIKSGNENSKFLIFTHDLPTVLNLKKIFKEFYSDNHIETMFYEMELNGNLKKIDKSRSEYNILLDKIFKFANEESFEDEVTIGNSIRRVLEAYSTFLYRKSIEKVSVDEEILSNLKESHREYFKNSMYKLFLHGESHFEELIKNDLEMTFYEEISLEEKIKISKDIISFMYLLNKNHILSYLKDKNEIIDKWCLEIEETFND